MRHGAWLIRQAGFGSHCCLWLSSTDPEQEAAVRVCPAHSLSLFPQRTKGAAANKVILEGILGGTCKDCVTTFQNAVAISVFK